MDAAVQEYIRSHLDEALRDLERLCNQPSVSAQNLGVDHCASLVRGMLEQAGMPALLLPTPGGGPPIVFGELGGASPRTILVYDHYDVQPPEPLDLWDSPPFQLTVRQGRAYARGVSDDKGCFVARLAAVRAWLRTRGRLPCAVKFILEGEEEVGSPHLGAFVEGHRGLLAADGCIWEGGGVSWEGQPQVTLGLKGILYVELEARGANRDVHSSYGGVVPNPAWRLAWALASLKDQRGRVRIKGFYDRVRRPSAGELALLRALPDEDEPLRQSLGLDAFLGGVRGYPFRRRYLLEPACNICGMEAGYTGPGSKTIVPSVARAKVDFRLVPDQQPEEVVRLLKDHLRERGFGDIQVVEASGHSAPARTPLDSPWVRLVSEAAREAYEVAPQLSPTIAGSGPMSLFTLTLGLQVASTAGVGYPENRIHAPNENIRLEDFQKAILHMAAILGRLGTE
ncbi:MAG: M20/M25/M40 family metallo-hydrolase [Chloroflexi bacterium]|nr:M20/M25/M40 family metallo-hydrolase [Chloroflexota bacterium]